MKFFATFLLCIAMLWAAAQDKFAPGFYVTPAGDSIHGLIQYKHNYGDGFSFRPDQTSRTKELTSSDAKAFAFDGGMIYENIAISIKNKPAVPLFVNVLISGEVDLYLYQRNYIIGSEKKGWFSLVKGKSSNEGEALKHYQANTGAFNILFQDCPEVKEAAQTVFMKDYKLRELVRSYHDCRKLPYEETRIPKISLVKNIGFYVGETFSTLSFGSPDVFPNSSYLSNAKFASSSELTFGMMALIGSRQPSPVMSFESGLAYSKGSYEGTFVYTSDVGGFNIKQTSVTTVDYSRLSLSGGLRFTGRSARLHPYGSFGVAVQQFLTMESSVHQTTEINSSVEVDDFELNTAKTALALWGSAGLKMNISGKRAIFLDVNYEYTLIADRGRITTIAPRFGFLF